MTAFNASLLKPASKSTEFAASNENKRTAKTILSEGITRQIALYKDAKLDGRRWLTIGQKEVALTLRIGNRPLKLIGEETKVVVPTEHVEAALLHYKAEVEKGTFDAQLAEAEKLMDARKTKMRKTRAAKKKD